MLRNFARDFKNSARLALRMTSLIAIIAATLFITMSFLCAAAFVFVFERYGLIFACLAGAGIFFVASLIAAGRYWYEKKQTEKLPAQPAQSRFTATLSDPLVVTAGLQLIRAVGAKRLLPLLAISGIAIGLMSQRKSPQEKTAGS